MKKYLLALTLVAGFTGCSFFSPQPVESPIIQSPEIPEPPQPKPVEAKTEDTGYSTYELPKTAPATAAADTAADIAAETEFLQPSRQKMYGAAVMGAGSMRMQAPALYKHGHAYVGSGGTFDSGVTNTESYDGIVENSFHQCLKQPISTFSIDVDTASYSNMRRMINQGAMPDRDAIRIEELINYFNYDYAAPTTGAFATTMEVAPALWNKKHRIVRIGIKGKEMKVEKRPASNLVFLIDVSGSMDQEAKLPLVKTSLAMLVDKLGENDKISMVVYAGAAGMVLSPTTGNNKAQILKAIEKLQAGGSTNGGSGIELAYKTAKENFIKGGVNRVILATDGDFNVGTTSRDGLLELVETNAKANVYLTILGFGMGNYKDGMMEALSNKGNGNYAYIDNQKEAKKVMVDQLSGTLVTIAKDVKIQVEFNPKFVSSYRLVGYENRVLKNEDFDNDKKDAGDIGAGHTVTALYEIVPAEVAAKAENKSDELLTLRIRYKKPDGDVSTKQEFVLKEQNTAFDKTSESFRFSSAVALFGMLLRNSDNAKEGTYANVIEVASKAKGSDAGEHRQEFIDLVKKVEVMKAVPVNAQLAE